MRRGDRDGNRREGQCGVRAMGGGSINVEMYVWRAASTDVCFGWESKAKAMEFR